MSTPQEIIANIESGHINLTKALDACDKYKQYLPMALTSVALLTEYIKYITNNIETIKKEIGDITKDPHFLQNYKEIIGKLGIDASTIAPEIISTMSAWAKNYAHEKTMELAKKYTTKLSVDIIVSLVHLGILPALVYNYLLDVISEEILAASGILDQITYEMETIISGIKAISFSGERENIIRVLNYVRYNISKDKSINLKIATAIMEKRVNTLNEDWLGKRNRYFKIAMEAMYPGDMLSDPEYADEFTNYKEIIRSNISLDALKRQYDASGSSIALKTYLAYWSHLMKSYEKLYIYTIEYDRIIASLKIHINNFANYSNMLKYINKKWTPNVIDKIINANANAMIDRVTYDQKLILKIDNLKKQGLAAMSLGRYNESLSMLSELKKHKMEKITQSTNLLSNIMALSENDLNELKELKFTALRNQLSLLNNSIKAMTFTETQINNLTKIVEGFNKNAILKKKELLKAKTMMSDYSKINTSIYALDLQSVDKFISGIGAYESRAALYMGDIKRCVELVDYATSSIGALRNMNEYKQNLNLNIKGLSMKKIMETTDANKNEKYSNVTMDTLLTSKTLELKKMQEESEKTLETANTALKNLKGENGS